MYDKLFEDEFNFITRILRWSLRRIDGLQLRLNNVNLIKGSKYFKKSDTIESKNKKRQS